MKNMSEITYADYKKEVNESNANLSLEIDEANEAEEEKENN